MFVLANLYALQLIVYAACTGYQISEDTIYEGPEGKTIVTTVHGHVANDVDEVDPLPEDIKNLRLPGSYWMEGGVFSAQGSGCHDNGDGSKYCPFSVITKAEGKFYDICYEMAKGLNVEYETYCDLIEVGWIAIVSITASGMLVTVTASTILSSA